MNLQNLTVQQHAAINDLVKALSQQTQVQEATVQGLGMTAAAEVQSVAATFNVGITGVSNKSSKGLVVPPTPPPTIEQPKIKELTSAQLGAIVISICGTSAMNSLKSSMSSMQSITDQMEAKNNQQMADMQNNIDSINKSQKWGKIGSWIGKAAAVVGLVFTVAALAATLLTGGAAGPLIALGVAALVGVLSLVNQATDGKLTAAIGKALDSVMDSLVKLGSDFLSGISGGKIKISDQLQQEIAQVLTAVTEMAVMLGIMIGCMAIGGGAGADEKLATNLAKEAKKFAGICTKANMLVQGAATTTEGLVTTGTSIVSYQGQLAQIGAKQCEAIFNALQSDEKSIEEMVKNVKESYEAMMNAVGAIISALGQTGSVLANSISKASA